MTRKDLIIIKHSLAKTGNKLSPNSKAFQQYKMTLKGLTKVQFDTAIGLILGDARIQLNKKGNGAILKFEWGDVNKDYAFHVYNVFIDYCISPPRKQVRISPKGTQVTTWCFQTLTHSDFVALAKLFIVNNKKIVPNGLIEQYLTPRGLSYWFMDDGGINGSHSYGLQLHTQSFSISEVDQMCDEIKTKFNLQC